MCGWTRSVYRKKATRKVFRYGTTPIEEFQVIRWMVAHGHPRDGRKKGFEVVRTMTIGEAVKHKSSRRIVDDIYTRAKELVELIEKARGEQDGEGTDG